jgi:hypothetical protein
MDTPKTPPQPQPFLPPVPGPHEVPVESKAQPLNARGPEGAPVPPPPPPFRTPTAQNLSGSLLVPSGEPAATARRLGLENTTLAPEPRLGGPVFGAPDRVTTVQTHEQIRDYSRRLTPR